MQLDFKQILNGVRKRWWLALIVLLTAAVVAFAYEKTLPDVYQSQVTLVAEPVPPDNGLIEAIQKTMPTYAQQLSNKDFWRKVVDDNHIQDVDIGALPGLIRVQPRPTDNSIVMTVDNGDPQLAAMLADRISNAFVEQQMAKTQDISAGGNRVVWTITQPAEVPQKPYQPRPLLTTAAAALFGLILGLLLAIVLELLDTSLKSPAEIQQYLGMNTVGVIPKQL